MHQKALPYKLRKKKNQLNAYIYLRDSKMWVLAETTTFTTFVAHQHNITTLSAEKRVRNYSEFTRKRVAKKTAP